MKLSIGLFSLTVAVILGLIFVPLDDKKPRNSYKRVATIENLIHKYNH